MDTLYMHTNLTPSHQAEASNDLPPEPASDRTHFEFEGADWAVLAPLIANL